MSRYITGNRRARNITTGLLSAVAVGTLGATATAVYLVNNAPAELGTVSPPMPSPVPMPGDTLIMEPRTDVLTYTIMSDLWAGDKIQRQERTCVAWVGGSVFKNGKIVTVSQDAIVASEMDRVPADQADWIEHGTVRLFLDETCAEILNRGEVGTAETRERNHG